MKPTFKTFLSWLLPALTLIAIFFIVQWWQQSRDEGADFPDSSPVVTPNFPSEAVEGIEVTPVDQITEGEVSLASEQRDEKMMVSALKSGDPKNCQAITRQELRYECEDSLNYGSLLGQDDPSQCRILHSGMLQQKCMDTLTFQKALANKNRKQCEVIQEEILRSRCLDELNFSLTQTSSNPTDCEIITNKSQKALCQDQMRLKMAISQNQVNLCNSILSQTVKTQCLTTIESNQIQTNQAQMANKTLTEADIEINGLERCELMVEETQQKCKDEAYFQAAFDEKNLLYCNQIQDEEIKTRCRSEQQAAIDQYYYKRAIQLKRDAECRLIENKEVEGICLENMN